MSSVGCIRRQLISMQISRVLWLTLIATSVSMVSMVTSLGDAEHPSLSARHVGVCQVVMAVELISHLAIVDGKLVSLLGFCVQAISQVIPGRYRLVTVSTS